LQIALEKLSRKLFPEKKYWNISVKGIKD